MNSSLDTLNYTSMHYDMDPQTEDLLPGGEDLREGMVVLIESSIVKENPNTALREGIGSEYAFARLKEANRWCEVTELRYSGYDSADSSRLVTFIGVYADGTKRQRKYSTGYAWFVKKDSLPKPAEPETNEVTEQENMEDSSDTVRYAEGDAEATMAMFPHTRALTITEDQLDRLGQAVREIVPEAEFRLEDEVWTLELTVDLDNSPEEETVTFTQIGTGAKATIPVSELKASKSFIEFHGRIEDIQSAEGPLARAIRETRARSGE